VLDAFPEVRVAPIALLRSPHEIAMSLFMRRGGVAGYRTSLDLVAVHFLRLRAILEAWPVAIPRLCFGSDAYLDDLARAVGSCGLAWDPSKVERLFDGSSVHHVPAAVVHEAQDVFDSLLDAEPRSVDESANQVRLQADAMAREDLLQQEFERSRSHAGNLDRLLTQTFHQKFESERQLQESRDELRRKEELLQVTRLDLGRTEESLHRTEESLHRTEESLHRTEESLHRTEESLHRTERELLESVGAHARTRDELTDALDQLAGLRARLDRFEGHRVIGAALRARRILRRGLQSLRTRAVAWDLHRR
jgi:hypothetical protein